MFFFQTTLTPHERSSATLTELFMIFKIATNKSKLSFEDCPIVSGLPHWTEKSFQVSHPFNNKFVCREKMRPSPLALLKYEGNPQFCFDSVKVENDFHSLCNTFPQTLFAIMGDGRIRVGSFFDTRFKITTQLTRQLALQDLFSSKQFAQMLWRTIVNMGGLDVLHQIYREQLDRIEFRLRFMNPMEEINLLPNRKHSKVS